MWEIVNNVDIIIKQQSVQHWEKNVTNVEEEIILAGNVELKIQTETDLRIKHQKHDK